MCGVSSLGIDHTQILGDTMEKIAWQKGGIFKVRRCFSVTSCFCAPFPNCLHVPLQPAVPAFTAPQPEGAMPVLEQRASDIQVRADLRCVVQE